MSNAPEARTSDSDHPQPSQLQEFYAEELAHAAAVANLMVAAEAGLITDRDPVVLPEHYARFKIEPIRFIAENHLNFMVGNVIKYVLRWDAKDGLQDLRKARRYMDMLIKFVEGDPDWWRAPAKGDA